MKLLLENWRQYLNENEDDGKFVCPDPDVPGWKVYYSIKDRLNPPSIDDILNCWVENSGYVYDSNVNWQKPALYDPADLVPYREYGPDRLRNSIGSERYEELKADIKENGIKDPLIIFFGRNGVAKIGEGNHRHEIAMALGLPKVPVRFVFWKNVNLSESI